MKAGLRSFAHLAKEAISLMKYVNQPFWFSKVNIHLSNALFLLHTTYGRPYVFIHINKTAGSSVSKALGYDHQIHMTSKMLKDLLGKNVYDQKYKFTFVRNPYDRVVSQYLYSRKSADADIRDNYLPFKEWVVEVYGNKIREYYDYPMMFLTQFDWISDYSGRIDIDFIGRFENLEEDFREVCRAVNLPAIDLGKEKTSENRKHYRQYYDGLTKGVVKKYFEKDLDCFKYSF